MRESELKERNAHNCGFWPGLYWVQERVKNPVAGRFILP
jgi:hypothetical protein